MDTNRAAYWIALAVLALGLTSEYRQGKFVALHRAAGRAGSVLCRISTHAEQTRAFASLLAQKASFSADHLLAAADETQIAGGRAELLQRTFRENFRAQVQDEIQARTDVLRAQADIRRAELEQIRGRAESRLARTSGSGAAVFCPRTGTRIVLNGRPSLVELINVPRAVKVNWFQD